MKRNQIERVLLMLPFSLGSLFASEAKLNNQGVTAYEQGNYQVAEQQLEQAQADCNEGGEYCDQVNYNLGNTHYRLGEAAEDVGEKKELWEKAVADYEASLKISPEDEQTQQNLEFVKQKLANGRSGMAKQQSW